MMPAGRNKECFFQCFVHVLVLCGLAYRAHVHVCRYDIWCLDALQAVLKNLRQLTGHKPQELWVPCRCAPRHICRDSLCSRDKRYLVEKYITSSVPYMINPFEPCIEPVCNHIVAVIVCTVTGHPTQKAGLRSASISKR